MARVPWRGSQSAASAPSLCHRGEVTKLRDESGFYGKATEPVLQDFELSACVVRRRGARVSTRRV